MLCSCKTQKFINCLQDNTRRLLNVKNHYCQLENDGSQQMVLGKPQKASDSQVQFKIPGNGNISVILSVYPLLIITTTLAYRYRWKVQHYLVNMGKVAVHNILDESCLATVDIIPIGLHDHYDIFVSYLREES